ncbi:MAG: MFS transporter [Pseudoxanthomonas suwonensis]|nr:MFS transporter [Pseudoxanthomonas suwonensis]
MFFFGFASGLPFLLVAGTLAYWLRQEELVLRDITLIASAGMAYSFKFLWAPLVDRMRLPVLGRLGQRRSWILLAQLLVIGGLLAMSLLGPGQLSWFVPIVLLVAFSGATLDIAVDAYRIEIAPAEAQGALVAVYSLGYRIALIVTGALALVLADHIDWPRVYQAMAVFMAVPLVANLLAREPDVLRERAADWATGLREGVVEPFADFFRRFGVKVAAALLMFILLFKISDQAMVGGLMGPFYLDQGFTLTQIAAVTKVYGIWIGIFGAFAGGVAVARWGIERSLLVAIIAGALSNLLYLLLIVNNGSLPMLTLVISGENFAQGFLGTAAVAYLSALVNQRYTATQYALFSSLITLPGKLLGAGSGWIVENVGGLGGRLMQRFGFQTQLSEIALGYGLYFLLTVVLIIPALLLFFWLRPRVALGGDSSATAMEEG